jgi:hypothetical protein
MLRFCDLTLVFTLLALSNLGLSSGRSAETYVARPLSQLGKSRMSATWQGQELGVALARLSATQNLEFWIDRGVDQQQPISIVLKNVTVKEALAELTAGLQLGYSPLSRGVYIGPVDSAHEVDGLCQLATESLQQASPAVRRLWLQPGSVTWPRLSVPRQLLRDWLQQAGIRLEHDEQIAHDLWPAGHFTSLSLMERVVLLLAGYDLTCRITPDGKHCTVVPIERPVVYTREYKFSPRQREMIRRFREQFPQAMVEQSVGELVLRGDWQQHQQLAKLLATTAINQSSTQSGRGRASRQVYSLKIENQPLGGVLDQLAHQWQVAVTWAPELQAKANALRATRVSCEVRQVGEDELLRVILEPSGLRFLKSEGRLEILSSE